MHEHRIVMPSGRRMGVAEFGDPAGHPVLYCHGSPSSRLEPLLIGEEAIAAAGLRILSPDRPGMGHSDFHAGRRIADWPSDVAHLAEHFQLPRFSLLGLSGGAPYVAACAATMSARIVRAVIVSGGWRMDWPEARQHLPFPNRMVMFLARRAQPVLRLLLIGMGSVGTGNREKELAQMRSRLPPADAAAFSAPGRLEAFGASMRACLAQGARGAAHDLGLYVRDFGLTYSVETAPMVWYHGTADVNAPLPLAQRAVAELPGTALIVKEDEAHLSLMCNHFAEIAASLR